MNKSLSKHPDLVILAIALFNIVIHLAVAGNLSYHRDEMLYLALGMHPAAGYSTVPPMIGLLSWLIQNIFGYSLFAVRLIPALTGGLMVMLVARIARELGGSRYASILASVGFIIAGFALRTFSMFMPVFIDVVFWTLFFYILVRYVNTGNDNYLLWFGITAGFSLLNKYMPGVIFLGLLLIVPFTKHRTIFGKKKFWLGIIAGFIIFLPNIIWQFKMGLPVLHHLAELDRTQLSYVNRFTFIAEQFMMASWASVLVVPGLIYLLHDKAFIRFRFLGYLALFVIIFLLILRGKSYYTIGIFPFLISAGAVSYDSWMRSTIGKIILPLALVLLTIPTLPLGLPVYRIDGLVKYFSILEKRFGMTMGRRFEDNSIHSLPQDYADMIGWEELTMVADSAWNMIEDKKAAFIYAENYGEAGAITIIGKKYNLPEAVCFNESFRYWIPSKFDPDITSIVYINYEEPGEDVRQLFRDVKKIGSITNIHAREHGTSVYLAREPVESFNSFWIRRVEELQETEIRSK
jgi:4-amino-4-deoxy-L-arabinose transferase-like glycosyltransferase